jgi:hypothetical protein
MVPGRLGSSELDFIGITGYLGTNPNWPFLLSYW